MKLIPIILSAIFFAFIAEPVYSEDEPELNLLIITGTCFPEHQVTIQLLPVSHKVIYKLYDPKVLTKAEQLAMLQKADIPLYLVDDSNCA